MLRNMTCLIRVVERQREKESGICSLRAEVLAIEAEKKLTVKFSNSKDPITYKYILYIQVSIDTVQV